MEREWRFTSSWGIASKAQGPMGEVGKVTLALVSDIAGTEYEHVQFRISNHPPPFQLCLGRLYLGYMLFVLLWVPVPWTDVNHVLRKVRR